MAAAKPSAKEPVLRARVSETIKARFEEICQRFGETGSDRLRQLVEDFVRQHASAAGHAVEVRIERPGGYDHGAWRISAALRNPDLATWNGSPVPFALPDLPRRLIVVADAEYRAAALTADRTPVLGGCFHDGIWRADLYSNGIAEDDNPTSLDVVRQAITDSIEEALRRFHGDSAGIA